jgi:hypothetical protein
MNYVNNCEERTAMNETICMNEMNASETRAAFNPIETDLSRPTDGYEYLLDDIRRSFNEKVKTDEPLFTTNSDNLYDIFLDNLPEEARQHYNCHECRRFVNTYGGLVTIDSETGKTTPVMWTVYSNNATFFHEPIKAVNRYVRTAKVTGVFLTTEKRLGVPKTGKWHHMAVDIPKFDRRFKHRDRIFTADQKMAEKKQDYQMLMRACANYKKETVESAVNLLRSNSLYRSEKILGIAEWFLNLKRTQGDHKYNFTNMVWKYVATAPAGFCHISSSMIGTLLDDIEAGMDFETVKRRFDEKMNPTKYQRPKAAPTAQNVARAEEIVAKLGIANSLKRRYARLSELQKVWESKTEEVKPVSGGVFSSVKVKGSENVVKPLFGHGATMTWDKFSRTVLPTAKKIEMYVPHHRDSFAALVTAVDPEAPPIIQWDTEENRNPFSWYLYSGGSDAYTWNLKAGNYVEVTGVVLQPNMWQPGYEHQGKGVFFILKDCKDTKNKTSGLFPEILRGELREVRATIEAYSRENPLGGDWEADACGLCYQGNGSHNWDCSLRVTTDVGVSTYKLDRWD